MMTCAHCGRDLPRTESLFKHECEYPVSIRCAVCKDAIFGEKVDDGPPIFRHDCPVRLPETVITLGTHGKLERRVEVLEKALEIACAVLAGHVFGADWWKSATGLRDRYIDQAEKEIP